MFGSRGWIELISLPPFRRGVAIVIAALLSTLLSQPLYAEIFVVDAVGDGVDAVAGDGFCATAVATCTLRAAIQEANALEGLDLVELPAAIAPGLYTLSIGGDNEDAAATGDLDITDDLLLHGTGGGRIILLSTHTDRVFDIPAGVSVEMSNFQMQDGNAGPSDGGGIRNLGDLVLAQLTIKGCNAANGGAIANLDGATLHLANVTLNGNTAAAVGGAIANLDGSNVSLLNATLTNNIASAGGGIRNLGTVMLENTILSNVDGGNCSGRQFTSLGHNIDSGGTCFLQGPGDRSSINAGLNQFVYAGGNSFTYTLNSNSPAIDAAAPTTCPGIDQRDFLRADGDNNGTFICDIGAYEFEGLEPTATPANTATPTNSPTLTGTLPPTGTPTETGMPTETATETPASTGTPTLTATISSTPAATFTPTVTATVNTPPATSSPTPVSTATEISTETAPPTVPPTATAPATPTATVEPPRLVVGTVEGSPGDSVIFPVVLRTGTFAVGSASNDLAFDPLSIPIAPLFNGSPDCVRAAGLEPAFRYRPFGCTGTDCTTLFANVFSITFPITAIADGTTIYSCRIAIAASAAPGTYPLALANIVVGDLQGNVIAGASGVDGEVTVVDNPCLGDCNGDGSVTVDEIVTLVSIALGTANLEACPAADGDDSGSVTVDEIVTAVTNALAGCPSD